jgi:hypothetical protein
MPTESKSFNGVATRTSGMATSVSNRNVYHTPLGLLLFHPTADRECVPKEIGCVAKNPNPSGNVKRCRSRGPIRSFGDIKKARLFFFVCGGI